MLRGGALAALALSSSLVGRRRATADAGDEVLIVGSGYAGAVVALRLAEHGIRSTIIERGRRWTVTPERDTFATARTPDGRAVWLSSTVPGSDVSVTPSTGVLEVVAGNGINCFAGAGVGGGSLVNYAVMMAPPEHLFRASFADSIDYADMVDTWYPRARNLIGCSPIPDDVLASPPYAGARVFERSMSRAGFDVTRPLLAVDWDVVRAEIAGTEPASATVGDCLFGVNSGAKKSVDRTVLAAAEATGLVTVVPQHRVRDVSRGDGGYLVSCEQLSLSGDVRGTVHFRARTLVLAAGSVGTSKIMVRARARGGLPDLSDRVGRYWGSAGDHITIRTGDPAVGNAQGGPAHVVATDWNNPSTPASFLGFPLGLPIVGPLVQGSLGVSIVPPVGFIDYDRTLAQGVVNWPVSDPRVAAVSRGIGDAVRRMDRADGSLIPSVASSAVTSHSLGGAVIGQVTDSFGRVDKHPGLYVVDSALIPGSTGSVPPALTVTALADRCAINLVADLIGVDS